MKEPLLVAWSSGKNSAPALRKILETDNYPIPCLPQSPRVTSGSTCTAFGSSCCDLLPLESDNYED
jgi:hypothetical protein